jgi:hypothetical protein
VDRSGGTDRRDERGASECPLRNPSDCTLDACEPDLLDAKHGFGDPFCPTPRTPGWDVQEFVEIIVATSPTAGRSDGNSFVGPLHGGRDVFEVLQDVVHRHVDGRGYLGGGTFSRPKLIGDPLACSLHTMTSGSERKSTCPGPEDCGP